MKLYERQQWLSTDLGNTSYPTVELNEDTFKAECAILEDSGYTPWLDEKGSVGYFLRSETICADMCILYKLIGDTEAGWKE